MTRGSNLRKYDRAGAVVFRKTDEQWGGLSNMAAGFPLEVSGIQIRTSEALYQACRFPHEPEVQRLIARQLSPMGAKMKSRLHQENTRPDWEEVRVKIMRWCLHVKLAQNWRTFRKLLLATGDRHIVEDSRKSQFWGANATKGGILVGANVLGRLLMELRQELQARGPEELRRVEPLDIHQFHLFGKPIGVVEAPMHEQLIPEQLEFEYHG